MAIKFRSPIFKTPALTTKGAISIGTVNGYEQWVEYSQAISLLVGKSSLTKLDTTTVSGQTLAFGRSAPVAAIISRIAEYAMNGRYTFVDSKGKETTVKNNLSNLLLKPNFLQTWTEFIASAVAFIKLHGQCYILPVTPAGFEQFRGAATSLFVIPNWMVTANYTGKTFYQSDITGVISSYRILGFSNSLPADKLLVIRDTMPSIINDQQRIFEGMSRLYSLGDQVNNLIAIQDALYTLTTKRGAMGAWTPENSKDALGGSLPIDPKEKKDVDEAFAGYGINSNQQAYIILRTGMKWVQAAMNVTDLKLFEGNEAAIQQVAMSYNMPIYLLGMKDSTFTNLEAAGKSCYTSSVIPCVDNICLNLSQYFGLGDIRLKAFFDHLDIFQKSKKDEADALNSMTSALDKPFAKGVIGISEYRQMIANFMPSGVPFEPEKLPSDLYQGQPTQTIVTQ